MELSMYIAFVLSFTIFAFIHSLTAANWFKEKASIVLGKSYKHYRIFYNIISVITFLPVFLIWTFKSGQTPMIYIAPQFLHLPLFLVRLISLIAAGVAFLRFDIFEFAGLGSRASKKEHKLVTSGLFSLVRHPMYLFIITYLWAKPDFSLFYLLVAFLFTAYFVVGAFLEERKLIEEFGDEYRRYQEKVPMFIPYKIFRWA